MLHICVAEAVQAQLVPVFGHALQNLGILLHPVATDKERCVYPARRKPVQKRLRHRAGRSVVKCQRQISLCALSAGLRARQAGQQQRQRQQKNPRPSHVRAPFHFVFLGSDASMHKSGADI